jgi:hypothetical protein
VPYTFQTESAARFQRLRSSRFTAAVVAQASMQRYFVAKNAPQDDNAQGGESWEGFPVTQYNERRLVWATGQWSREAAWLV